MAEPDEKAEKAPEAESDEPTAPNPPAAEAKPSEPKAEASEAKRSEPMAKAASEPKLAATSEPKVKAPASAPAVKAASGSNVKAAFPTSVKTAIAKGEGGAPEAYEALARSARLSDLVGIAQKVLSDATLQRRAEWSHAASVEAAAEELKLARSDADTPYGNALGVLGTGPEGDAERALASALAAHAIAEGPRDDEDRIAADVLWLAANTAFDALPLLDRALGDDAADVWTSIGELVRRFDEGRGSALRRGEAVLGAAALAASSSPAASKAARDIAEHAKDPLLARLAQGAEGTAEVTLEGEMVPAPRSMFVTTILAFTGLLFVMHALRFVARIALAYKRPTEVALGESGVRVTSRTEMLGRVLREQEHVIVRAGLVRVVREVRYPRLAFYSGLFALALGSYIGVRALVDGVRAASPSLLLTGLAIVVLGIAIDFVFGTILPGARGRCRVAFVPRTGKTLCVADVDLKTADAALRRALR